MAVETIEKRAMDVAIWMVEAGFLPTEDEACNRLVAFAREEQARALEEAANGWACDTAAVTRIEAWLRARAAAIREGRYERP